MQKNVILLLFALVCMQVTVNAQDVRSQMINHIIKEKIRIPSTSAQAPLQDVLKQLKDTAMDFKVSLNSSTSVEEGEPFIAVNPGDSNNVVLSYMEFGGASTLSFPVYYSNDGGQSWSLSSISTEDVFENDSTGLVIGGGGDPIFAFDANGKLYFSWIYLAIDMGTLVADFRVYWAYSNDGGATFELAENGNHILAIGDFDFIQQTQGNKGDGIFDRPWFDVDISGGPFDGSVYCSGLFLPNAVTPLAGNGMVCKYKRANVDSFAYYNAPVSTQLNVQFGNTRVDGSGNVHVSYCDNDAGKVYHSLSSDGGVTFNTPSLVGNVSYSLENTDFYVHTRENPAPSLAVSKANNAIHLVWTSFENEQAVSYYSHSFDLGATWSTQIDIASLLSTAGIQVFMPTLAINEDGLPTISGHVMDEQDRGTYFVIQSLDEGLTFESDIIVASDSTYFHDYPIPANQTQSGAFFGDYECSARSGCKTFSIWSDGRFGAGPKVYVAITDHCAATLGVEDVIPVSDQIQLLSVYPNPVKDELAVHLNLKQSSSLNIKLIGLNGQVVRQLYQSSNTSGVQKLNFNIDDSVESGVLILLIESDLGQIRKSIVKL